MTDEQVKKLLSNNLKGVNALFASKLKTIQDASDWLTKIIASVDSRLACRVITERAYSQNTDDRPTFQVRIETYRKDKKKNAVSCTFWTCRDIVAADPERLNTLKERLAKKFTENVHTVFDLWFTFVHKSKQVHNWPSVYPLAINSSLDRNIPKADD